MSRSEQMSHHRGDVKACPKFMSMSGPSQNIWMVGIVDRLLSLGRSWNGRTTLRTVQHGVICFANTTTMVIFVIRGIFVTVAGARIIPRLACLSRGVVVRLGRRWTIKDARPTNQRGFLSSGISQIGMTEKGIGLILNIFGILPRNTSLFNLLSNKLVKSTNARLCVA